jgi:hypothetical protein
MLNKNALKLKSVFRILPQNLLGVAPPDWNTIEKKR